MDYKYKHSDASQEVDYPKLVRDNIPDINLKRWGKELDHRIATDDKEYLAYLLKKLTEEAEELQFSPAEEIGDEIADVYEIIDAIIKVVGLSKSEIEKFQKVKRTDQGGFEKRVLMLSKNMPE
ncbi:MAG: nucleoside triphosphate pyrophosphohydrolase [bacterium]|nr:nucleoside triphosphate pyrophosphohydrolase [bacterium]